MLDLGDNQEKENNPMTDQAYRFRPSNAGNSLYSHVFFFVNPRREQAITPAKDKVKRTMSIQSGALFEQALVSSNYLVEFFSKKPGFESGVKVEDQVNLSENVDIGGTADFLVWNGDKTLVYLLDAKAMNKKTKREIVSVLSVDDRNYMTQLALYRAALQTQTNATIKLGWFVWSTTSSSLFDILDIHEDSVYDELVDQAKARYVAFAKVQSLISEDKAREAAELAVSFETPFKDLEYNTWGHLTGIEPLHWHKDRDLLFDQDGFRKSDEDLIDILEGMITKYLVDKASA